MKTRIKRLLSFIVCATMLITIFPTVIYSATGSLSSSTSDSTSDNGVKMTKTVTYDKATGKLTTVVEAYTTGTVTSSAVAKPTDIVLVLDTSGSMDYSFSGSDNNSGERLTALKNTIADFIDTTAAHNAGFSNAADMHSIAIITFASESTVLSGFTTVNASGAATLKSAVNGLVADGATAVDYALTDASELLSARATENNGAYAEREKVVIVFTDGDPTHSSSYSDHVAHDAVNDALMIKSMGAKIYTVGIFNGADASATDDSNTFMNYVSSNYPKAYGYTEEEYFLGFIPIGTSYLIAAGAEPYNTGYYLTADNATELTNMFHVISDHIGRPDIHLGASAALIDVVSDYFTIEGLGTTSPTIKAETADYNGNNEWAAPVDAGNIWDLTGTDTIKITGFNFDENYISETARNGFKGKKLILTFVTTPNYDAIDAANLTSAVIPTNDTAALLDSDGTAVEYVASPTITANVVQYNVVTGNDTKTTTYYRLPGAAVTIAAKPANTAQYTYSDWAVTGITVQPGDTGFTMPEADVVLTSTAAVNSYTVTYEYRGTVPSGVAPAANALPTYTKEVGATVDHPAVTDVPAGYTFSGWVEDGGDIEAGVSSFTMPAENLHFVGRFIAQATSYKVEHYLMNTDGTYSETADHSNVYTGVYTGDTVKATVPDHTGFTYDQTKTTSENSGLTVDATGVTGTVSANNGLVLKVYYKRNTHTVTYKYDTAAPDGAAPDANALANISVTAYYGQTVSLQPVTVPSTYTFSGWRVYTGDTRIVNGEFVMPDSDVVLHGSFTENGPAEYKIEHYFENLDDDGYTLEETTTRSGKIGATAYAEPLSDIEGFKYNPGYTGEVVSGTITDTTAAGTDPLTLKLYYTRARHTVVYEYTGAVPADANPGADNKGVVKTETYKYGANVEIDGPATATGYTFVGWNVTGADIPVSDNAGVKTFEMPARDVVLTGHFNHIPSKYTVQHWLENTQGGYTKVASTEYSTNVYANDQAKAVPNQYNTYLYDEAKTASENTGLTVDATGVTAAAVGTDGNLVLKLYYTRKAYDITYRFENNPDPNNINTPASQTGIKHGTEVDLATVSAPVGYTFDGWYNGEDNVGNKLTMPRKNVELVGKFIPNDAKYTVVYHLQNLDGTYTESDAGYERTGKTGTYVVADTKDFPGFSFDIDNSAWNGHIEGDGSLVLNLYYNRNSYNVTYYYFGTPPANTEISLDGNPLTLVLPEYVIHTESVLYGTPMTVKSALTVSNSTYEFRGWHTANLPGISADAETVGGTAYTMPAHNVEFRGAVYNYIVYYNLDGGTLDGSLVVPSKEASWNDANLLPVGTPQKDGKIFAGWIYEDRSTYVTNGVKYSDLATDMDVSYIVLTAAYTDAPYFPPVIPFGEAKLTKVDADDSSTVLPGVVFEFYKANGDLVGTYTTDENGEIVVPRLVAGDYYWKEIHPAEGYAVSEETYPVRVPIWDTVETVVTNKKTEVPTVFIDDHYAYIIGRDDGLVHPEANITRAEVATIFFRMLTEEVRSQYLTRENSFSDVNEGDWYNTAVSTMAAMGIVNGRPGDVYDPNDYITRAEFAAIAARFEEHGNDSDSSFSDIYDHWAMKEINIAANNGWVLGYEDGSFKPNQCITRAEAMTMVNRVLQRIPESAEDLLDDMIIWPDNADTSKWYYLMVQEATNSHYYARKPSGYEYWTEIREIPDWTALQN